MKKQIFNPYLPEHEYVPDGEPHLFDGRVYVYGSHDRAFGTKYCEGHYVTWSAPETDLTDWRYEGVIYRRDQDPSNADDTKQLWAPDVTRGPDGRYYLYYCFNFLPEIGVAVSDSPAGPFEFHGHVKYPAHIRDGATLREFMPFDPAVLTDDDGRVYLYYGFTPAGEKKIILPNPDDPNIPEEEREAMRSMIANIREVPFGEYSMCAELEPDMLTVKEVPHELIPNEDHAEGTSFAGHGFFEASSIRKVGSKYYFVYSSHRSHELCYAVSDRPDGDFVYGGTLVSNGDIGLNGRTEPVNVLGNNHGGIVQAAGEWYVFYHRQTNGTEFSRQGCAEKIAIAEDGSIRQAEITSCGLNGGPLAASGTYPAAIACHITDPTTCAKINYQNPVMQQQTRITATEDGKRQFITAIRDGSKIGYKYFDFSDVSREDSGISLTLRGRFNGKLTIAADESMTEVIGAQEFDWDDADWGGLPCLIQAKEGAHGLFFGFSGEGELDMMEFTFD